MNQNSSQKSVKKNKTKKFDLERWTIRMCALAMASGLYLTVKADEKDKNSVPCAVTTCTCSVLGGIGIGMATRKFLTKEKD